MIKRGCASVQAHCISCAGCQGYHEHPQPADSEMNTEYPLLQQLEMVWMHMHFQAMIMHVDLERRFQSGKTWFSPTLAVEPQDRLDHVPIWSTLLRSVGVIMGQVSGKSAWSFPPWHGLPAQGCSCVPALPSLLHFVSRGNKNDDYGLNPHTVATSFAISEMTAVVVLLACLLPPPPQLQRRCAAAVADGFSPSVLQAPSSWLWQSHQHRIRQSSLPLL